MADNTEDFEPIRRRSREDAPRRRVRRAAFTRRRDYDADAPSANGRRRPPSTERDVPTPRRRRAQSAGRDATRRVRGACPTRTAPGRSSTPRPGASARRHRGGGQRRRRHHRPLGLPGQGDADLVPRVLDERHRLARAARRARRPEAGAPPHPVRHERERLHAQPPAHEVGAYRRRRHRQVPPARRFRRVRHHGAPGAAVLHARAAGGRPRQLRLHRRRRARRPCATPRRASTRRPWSFCATWTRRRWTSSRTTTKAWKSPPCCPPASRTCWSTARRASPWAWPRTSRRTTWARPSTPRA